MIGLRLASQRLMARAARELESGRTTWFISLGSSMAPSIKIIQRVELRPLRPEESLNGRVALAQVGGRFWLHRISGERSDEVRVVADNGTVNGWTPRTAVFGVLD